MSGYTVGKFKGLTGGRKLNRVSASNLVANFITKCQCGSNEVLYLGKEVRIGECKVMEKEPFMIEFCGIMID